MHNFTIAGSAVEIAASFLWDNVLGNYLSAVLAAATVWLARKLYARRQRSDEGRQERAEE